MNRKARCGLTSKVLAGSPSSVTARKNGCGLKVQTRTNSRRLADTKPCRTQRGPQHTASNEHDKAYKVTIAHRAKGEHMISDSTRKRIDGMRDHLNAALGIAK